MERFWSKVEKSNGCWNWTGASNQHGYGYLRRNRKTQSVHRYSYVLHYGPIPDGLNVNHHCDNRLCVNPTHLYAGTQSENIMDAVRRGRLNTATGKRSGKWRHPPKLNLEKATMIRYLLSKKRYRQADIGDLFGVTGAMVSEIKLQNVWAEGA